MLSVLCCEGNGRGSNVRGLPLNLCCLFVRGLVEGHLLIGIRRSAHVPRICMEESVVAKAVPKRPRYGLDIAQRTGLRLRNGLEFIVLVLAGNSRPPPAPKSEDRKADPCRAWCSGRCSDPANRRPSHGIAPGPQRTRHPAKSAGRRRVSSDSTSQTD